MYEGYVCYITIKLHLKNILELTDDVRGVCVLH